jgi:hypothetical protein
MFQSSNPMTMREKKPSSSTARRNHSNSDMAPPPADLPKNFPEKTPLSDDGIEAAKKEAASSMKSGPGEDPLIESGTPKNDPEVPRDPTGRQAMD